MARNRKLTIGIVVGIILILIGVSLIPVQVEPYGDTRIILEHTHQTYIVPPCFEQAETTNNIAETTLDEMTALDYKPESQCTEQALQSSKKPLLAFIAEKLSLKESEWDW